MTHTCLNNTTTRLRPLTIDNYWNASLATWNILRIHSANLILDGWSTLLGVLDPTLVIAELLARFQMVQKLTPLQQHQEGSVVPTRLIAVYRFQASLEKLISFHQDLKVWFHDRFVVEPLFIRFRTVGRLLLWSSFPNVAPTHVSEGKHQFKCSELHYIRRRTLAM